MIPLIEKKKEHSKLSFYGEVKSLEFCELYDNMNEKDCVDQKRRDKKLKKIGEKLLKKPINKFKKFTFEVKIYRGFAYTLLTQEEIDELLTTGKMSRRLKKARKWVLVIYFNDYICEIRFPFFKIKIWRIKFDF